MFDGSSIAGWKGIQESDMILMPDPATACIDPFFEAPTLPVSYTHLDVYKRQGRIALFAHRSAQA